jgi:hypothetical protein
VRVLTITLRGQGTAKRTWPVETREVASWTIRWLVPASQLAVGRRFPSNSARVVGTASARGASVSCRGTLSARRAPFLLVVVSKSSTGIGFTASPSAFATALSPSCQQGAAASHWPLRTAAERHDWWLFNNVGLGVSVPGYGPARQGGSGEGWKLAHGVHWLVTLEVT